MAFEGSANQAAEKHRHRYRRGYHHREPECRYVRHPRRGETVLQPGTDRPHAPADRHRPQRAGRHRTEPVAEGFGDRFPGGDGGRRPLLGDQHRHRVRYQAEVDDAADQAAGQYTEALRHDLMPRRRADHVADLQIVQQIGALAGRTTRDIGADQVGGGLPGRCDAGRQLRYLADRADRRDTGLTDHAGCDRGEQERDRHRKRRDQPLDIEDRDLRNDDDGAGRQEPDQARPPGAVGIDSRAAAAQSGHAAPRGCCLQQQACQCCRDHHGDTRP